MVREFNEKEGALFANSAKIVIIISTTATPNPPKTLVFAIPVLGGKNI